MLTNSKVYDEVGYHVTSSKQIETVLLAYNVYCKIESYTNEISFYKIQKTYFQGNFTLILFEIKLWF